MSDYDDISPVVIDNGSGTTRAGFAGDEDPICVNSTVIGKPRSYTKCKSLTTTGHKSKRYKRLRSIKDEAQKRCGVLSLDYPIEHRIVTNWDDMELIWHDIYNSYLEVPPEEHPCLPTEPPLNPKYIREKMAQIFFEKFKVPAFFVCMQGVLSCYWSGRGSAIMLEIGDGVTHIVPVCEGDFEIVKDMKENMCYIAEDYSKEITLSECFPDVYKSYELPDGNLITIGKERFQCPKILFRPSKERMLTNVVAPPERKDSSWIGGSILASLSTFQSMWITNAEYEEYGPDIVNRKCY